MPEELESIRKELMTKNPKMPKSLAYALATNMLKKRGKGKKPLSRVEKKMGHRIGSAAHKRMVSKKKY